MSRAFVLMAMASIACAAVAGYLFVKGAPHLSGAAGLAALIYSLAAVGEYVAAARRRRQRHAPFVRPGLPTETSENGGRA